MSDLYVEASEEGGFIVSAETKDERLERLLYDHRLAEFRVNQHFFLDQKSETLSPEMTIYVAGPYTASSSSGIARNVELAGDWGCLITKVTGWNVLIPHKNTSGPQFDDVHPYDFWIKATLSLMKKCDIMFVMPGHEYSEGTRGEIQKAGEIGMEMFTKLENLIQYTEVKNNMSRMNRGK